MPLAFILFIFRISPGIENIYFVTYRIAVLVVLVVIELIDGRSGSGPSDCLRSMYHRMGNRGLQLNQMFEHTQFTFIQIPSKSMFSVHWPRCLSHFE